MLVEFSVARRFVVRADACGFRNFTPGVEFSFEKNTTAAHAWGGSFENQQYKPSWSDVRQFINNVQRSEAGTIILY